MNMFEIVFKFSHKDQYQNTMFTKYETSTELINYFKALSKRRDYKRPYHTYKNITYYKITLMDEIKNHTLIKGKQYKILFRARKWHYRKECGVCLDAVKIMDQFEHPENQQKNIKDMLKSLHGSESRSSADGADSDNWLFLGD